MAEVQVISDETTAALRRFMELRDARDEAETKFEAAKKDYREAEAELWDALKEGVEGSLKIPLGPPWGTVSLSPQATTYGKVLNERRLQDYLEERQMLDEYSAPKLVAGRLNEFVRKIKEQGEKMPPGLDSYERKYIRVSMPKAK